MLWQHNTIQVTYLQPQQTNYQTWQMEWWNYTTSNTLTTLHLTDDLFTTSKRNQQTLTSSRTNTKTDKHRLWYGLRLLSIWYQQLLTDDSWLIMTSTSPENTMPDTYQSAYWFMCIYKGYIIFTKKPPTIDAISRLLLTTGLYHAPKLDKAQKLHKPQTDARISIESDNSPIIICRCVCHHCSNKCLFWIKIFHSCTLHGINQVIDWSQRSLLLYVVFIAVCNSK